MSVDVNKDAGLDTTTTKLSQNEIDLMLQGFPSEKKKKVEDFVKSGQTFDSSSTTGDSDLDAVLRNLTQ